LTSINAPLLRLPSNALVLGEFGDAIDRAPYAWRDATAA